jgi:tRNA(adenine34) deaminase
MMSIYILHKFIFMINLNEFYMQKALREAERAFQQDEVPVGAVIVYKKKIIAKAYNRCVQLCDPTAHAEIQTITSACNYLQSRYLNDCELYTTLEPCIMCFGAIFWSKIKKVTYGASAQKFGFTTMKNDSRALKTKLVKGILEEKCSNLLTCFFQKKRKLK